MKIGLVLGGGGARGFAHIGVLQAIEEAGLEPVAIAGCSMGGIVGAMAAAGYGTEDMLRLANETSFSQFLDFGEMGGLIGGKPFSEFFNKHLPPTFGALKMPLVVTTVDVQEGQLLLLRSGPLAPALRATSALPGIISPVRHLNRVLIDGGLLNNLPVDVIRTLTLEPVLAVDVAAPPDRKLRFDDNRDWWKKVTNPFGRNERALTIELFMKAFDIPQRLVTEMRLALHPPDLLLRPTLDPDLKVEDFHKLDQAVRAGYESARHTVTAWAAAQRAETRDGSGERV